MRLALDLSDPAPPAVSTAYIPELIECLRRQRWQTSRQRGEHTGSEKHVLRAICWRPSVKSSAGKKVTKLNLESMVAEVRQTVGLNNQGGDMRG